MGRTIAWATLVAGILDIVFAAILTLLRGGAQSIPLADLRAAHEGFFPALMGADAALA